MPRLAPAGGWFITAALLACSQPPAPTPTKVLEPKNLIQGPVEPESAKPSPFTLPDVEPPPPRSEPQLPPEELAATLAKAERARQIDDKLEASVTLRACANKVPQSVRCEGELAAILAKMPRYRYETEYYLAQAIAGDDPELGADYYRRLGEALASKGKYAEAATAYQRMIDRSAPATADDYNRLAVALQGVPERLSDAAVALRKAYELDPTRHEWLRDEAILLGQQPDKISQAITRFEEFKTKVSDPAMLTEADQRIAELRAQLAAPSEPAPATPKPRRKRAPAP